MADASDSATSTAAKGATYLMALQISSRALTFVLNQILMRFLSPETLGRAVQLELYSISVLFFARESLRIAVQRVGASDSTSKSSGASKQGSKSQAGKPVQTVVNLSYLTLLLGLPLTVGLGVVCQRALSATTAGLEDNDSGDFLNISVLLYGFATLVELASEPGFVAAQSLLLFKVRAGAEAAATVCKTFATVFSALAAHNLGIEAGVLPFAYGQMAYAFMLWVFYSAKMHRIGTEKGFQLLPLKFRGDNGYISGYFSKPLVTLATSLSVQSGIKYVLTQGDSILIATLASLQDQGTYALASNYGGLIARMLFQPIEEASRNLFAKLCSETAPVTDKKAVKGKKGDNDDGRKTAATILTTVLHLYSLIGLLAVSMGPSLAPLLLNIIAGSRWTDLGAGKVLGTYAYYIPLLAINGVTEAFVAVVASNKELYRQSLWMGVFFVSFASSAWWFVAKLNMGAEGIVWSNCVNMTGRIIYCVWFISSYFQSKGIVGQTLPSISAQTDHSQNFNLRAALPSAANIAATATVPALLRLTKGWFAEYGISGEFARLGWITVLLVLNMYVCS